MKWLAKPFLWLLTGFVPVFIAACYGPPTEPAFADGGNDPEKSVAGRVLNALTGTGIPYIQVSCLVSGYSGIEVYDDTYSAPEDGSFELWSSEYTPCERLLFEDVDGEENGAFVSKEVVYEELGQDVVVELSAQN